MPRKARESGRTGGEDSQESLDAGCVAHVGDVREVAAEDRRDIAGEEPRASPSATVPRVGESAGDDLCGIRFESDLGIVHVRRLAGEQPVDEALASPYQLNSLSNGEKERPDEWGVKVLMNGE
jgi:hypothetical protein